MIVKPAALLPLLLPALLAAQPDFRVLGQVTTALDAVNESRRLKPDVVVMDLALPEANSVAASVTITAAASKYTATPPLIPRNEAGKISGATVAATLYAHAAPVPIAIKVNMFR